jgi:glycine/D-amino acid oxidase-like deaminating enzyme
MSRIAVVGAGIVGSAIAYYTATRGAAVTLLDKSLPGSGATGASFAWIGESGEWPGGMKSLKTGVLAAWRELETQVPEVKIRWVGSLSVEPRPSGEAGTTVLRNGLRRVGAADIARLEPNLKTPPDAALYAANDGALDSVAVTGALALAAQDRGADLVVGTAVTSVRLDQNRVVGVGTSSGYIPADIVVLAAGVDVPALSVPLGVHVAVAPSPAIRMRFAAPVGIVQTVFSTPDFEVRQHRDGELLATTPYRGEITSDDLDATTTRVTETIRIMFRGLDGLTLKEAQVGMRPMTSDSAPIIGSVAAVPGLYLAVMHSGVTLGPMVGRLVAEEVCDSLDTPELESCRPDRFLNFEGGLAPRERTDSLLRRTVSR